MYLDALLYVSFKIDTLIYVLDTLLSFSSRVSFYGAPCFGAKAITASDAYLRKGTLLYGLFFTQGH